MSLENYYKYLSVPGYVLPYNCLNAATQRNAQTQITELLKRYGYGPKPYLCMSCSWFGWVVQPTTTNMSTITTLRF